MADTKKPIEITVDMTKPFIATVLVTAVLAITVSGLFFKKEKHHEVHGSD